MKEEGKVEFAIRAAYGDMRKSEKKVADHILTHMPDMRKMTLAKLAEDSGVSQPTVMRMLKAAGFGSFRTLKYKIIEELAQTGDDHRQANVFCGYHINKNDKIRDIPVKVTSAASTVIMDAMKSISINTYESIICALLKAEQISIYGIENSSAACEDLDTKMMYLGMDCKYVRDPYLQQINAATLTEHDVAVGISYSGMSRDTVDAMRIAKEHGATTIVLTNFKDSMIGQYADMMMCSTQEQLFYGNAVFSRMSQILMIDMIYMGLIAADYDKYTERLRENSLMVESKAYK